LRRRNLLVDERRTTRVWSEGMSKMTVYEYAVTIEALYEYLNNHMESWWVRDIISKMQADMRIAITEAVNS
jgi:hypothetical protein